MTNNIDKQSFGEAGCVLVTGTDASIPAGHYCAVSFITDTEFTTDLSAAEAPLLTGTQAGITFPAGFTLFTPLVVVGTSTGEITGTAIFYKAL
jgi:hypothetical protein